MSTASFLRLIASGRQPQGVTLIEVLVVSVVLGIFSLIGGQALVSIKGFDAQTDQKNATTDALLSTLIQLRAAPYSNILTEFSSVNTCKMRVHSLTGTFMSQQNCSSPSSPGIYVQVTRKNTDLDTIEFKNPDGSSNDFLKLPRHDGAVLAFEVRSVLRPAVGSEYSFSMTLYRR